MKSILLLFTIFLFSQVFPVNLYCQNDTKKFELTFTTSIYQQDRRLFDFPNKDKLIEMEESNLDHEFSLLFNKTNNGKAKIGFDYGAGYSMRVSKFSRPFDHPYYTGIYTEELRFIEEYKNHELLLDGIFEYKIDNSDNDNLTLIFPINLRFTFNNKMTGTIGNFNENKNDFNFDNIELNGGIKYTFHRFCFSFTTRLLNFQRKDPVIFYGILFNEANPKFLESEFEFKNFFKLNFGIHFKL
jgi:hypothetical protein